MNLKLIKESVLLEIEGNFNTTGFKWIRSKGYMMRKLDFGFQRIAVTVDNFNYDEEGVEVDLIFGIRIDSVEKTFAPYRDVNPLYAKDLPTHSASIGQLMEDSSFRYKMKKESDVDGVFDQILKSIKDFGMPFFEKYSDILNLDNLYNNNKDDLSVKMKSISHRAFLSLILAKHADRQDWLELVKYFRDELESKSSKEVRAVYPVKFNQLVESLFGQSIL